MQAKPVACLLTTEGDSPPSQGKGGGIGISGQAGRLPSRWSMGYPQRQPSRRSVVTVEAIKPEIFIFKTTT